MADALYINDISFKDPSHIKKHLDYLFRADPEQKWTNKNIAKNIFAFISNSNLNIFSFPDNISYREELRDKIYTIIMQIISKFDISYIKTVRLDYMDNYSIETIQADLQNDMFDLQLLLTTQFSFPILLVFHNDDKKIKPHLHVVYFNSSLCDLVDIT